jgi:hypothetical protein
MLLSRVLVLIGLVVLLTGVPGSFGQTGPTISQPQESKPQDYPHGYPHGYPRGYPVILGDQTLFCIKRDVCALYTCHITRRR